MQSVQLVVDAEASVDRWRHGQDSGGSIEKARASSRACMVEICVQMLQQIGRYWLVQIRQYRLCFYSNAVRKDVLLGSVQLDFAHSLP